MAKRKILLRGWESHVANGCYANKSEAKIISILKGSEQIGSVDFSRLQKKS